MSRQVGGSLEVDVLYEQVVGRANRLHRRALTFTKEDHGFIAEADCHRAAGQEKDQAEMGEQRRQLEILVPVAVYVEHLPTVVGIGGFLSDTEMASAQCSGQLARGPVVDAGETRSFGQAQVIERRRLDDLDVVRRAPQVRRSVQRADDDADDEQREQEHEPRRGEDAEEADSLEYVDHARPDVEAEDGHGVVDGMHLGHLLRVRGGIVERERGQLAEQRPDHPRDRQQADLEHGETNAGQRVPDGPAEAFEWVELRAGTTRAEGDGRDESQSLSVSGIPLSFVGCLPSGAARRHRRRGGGERLVEVGDQIVDILQPD